MDQQAVPQEIPLKEDEEGPGGMDSSRGSGPGSTGPSKPKSPPPQTKPPMTSGRPSQHKGQV